MSEAPLMPAPKTPKDDTDAKIARLVNAGLIQRSQLPILRAAKKNLQRKGDIAFIPKLQRQALQGYNDALQAAALKTTGSVGVVRRNINAGVELEGDVIAEEILNEEGFQPPPMMTLRRTGIRIFPDGRRVALYVSNKYNLMFSVPYKSTGAPEDFPVVQAEEIVLENIEQLAEVKEGETKKVKVGDETMDIHHQTAMDVLRLHSKLNDANKKIMQQHIKDPEKFKKILDLAKQTQ